jgi:hydroxymethylglutaryl-CoA synthase
MFSYGSGLSSSFFSFQIKKSVVDISKVLNIQNRLKSRLELSPSQFSEVMRLREETHGKKGYKPVGDETSVKEVYFSGT